MGCSYQLLEKLIGQVDLFDNAIIENINGIFTTDSVSTEIVRSWYTKE